MKALPGFALIALLTGCATTARESDSWLVGTWLMLGDDIEYPLACASGLPVIYARGGRYSLFEEEGRWRLEGNRLTETATEATGAGDPEMVEIGVPNISTIERRGTDEFRKTFSDGSVETFRRCPEAA